MYYLCNNQYYKTWKSKCLDENWWMGGPEMWKVVGENNVYMDVRM